MVKRTILFFIGLMFAAIPVYGQAPTPTPAQPGSPCFLIDHGTTAEISNSARMTGDGIKTVAVNIEATATVAVECRACEQSSCPWVTMGTQLTASGHRVFEDFCREVRCNVSVCTGCTYACFVCADR